MPHENVLYTVASTFEKKNSLGFRLIFGKPAISRPALHVEPSCSNAMEHFFSPGQIFGLELLSRGKDFKKFHHVLVLRSCKDGECGVVVPGVNPGAEVLVQAMNNSLSLNLICNLNIMHSKNIDLTKISTESYQYLNKLLYLKISADFFIGELIEQAKSY